MLVCHPVDPPYRPTDPRCSTSGLTGRSMMREFLKAPVVFGHPNQNRFSIFVRPQLVISRGFSSTSRKWTKKWTSQIPPNKNTQPGTRPAPHGVSHPVQEHRPCSDHPNQEDESLGRRTSWEDDLGWGRPRGPQMFDHCEYYPSIFEGEEFHPSPGIDAIWSQPGKIHSHTTDTTHFQTGVCLELGTYHCDDTLSVSFCNSMSLSNPDFRSPGGSILEFLMATRPETKNARLSQRAEFLCPVKTTCPEQALPLPFSKSRKEWCRTTWCWINARASHWSTHWSRLRHTKAGWPERRKTLVNVGQRWSTSK